jgi:transposase, IS5 family
VLHVRTLPGNLYDGHTLGAIIEATQRLTGQKRGIFGRINRELRRRFAIEAMIGHMKAEGHLGRCYLKGRL